MPIPFDPQRIPAGSALDIYISPSCPYCRTAMEHYDRTGTPYTVHNAADDPAERERMLFYASGDPTVPAIVVDGTYMQSGWGDPPRG